MKIINSFEMVVFLHATEDYQKTLDNLVIFRFTNIFVSKMIPKYVFL